MRFGRRVDENGVLIVNREIAVAVADFGNAARLNLEPWAGPVLMKRRTVALMVLWVVYHLPLACRRAAVGWTG